jgi:hypothetical protein
MVVEMKKLESEVVKIIETDEWLVIKPLSHRASVKYGYGTKWCTAMQDRVSYFDEYTSNGMLIYCINKKTNDKVALHKKISGGSELSWWDVTDKRVDLLEINIPNDVIDAIRKDITSNKKTNAMLKIELDKKNGNTSKSVVEDLKTLSINDISNLVVRPTNDNSDLYRRALALMDRM